MTLAEFTAWLDGYMAAGGADLAEVRRRLADVEQPPRIWTAGLGSGPLIYDPMPRPDTAPGVPTWQPVWASTQAVDPVSGRSMGTAD